MRSIFRYWVSGMFAVSTMIAAITGYKWRGLTFRHHNLNRKKESGLSTSEIPFFDYGGFVLCEWGSEPIRWHQYGLLGVRELCQAGRGVQVELSYAHVQGSVDSELYNAGPPIGISVVHGSLQARRVRLYPAC